MSMHNMELKRSAIARPKRYLKYYGWIVLPFLVGFASALLFSRGSADQNAASSTEASDRLSENLLLLSQQVDQLFLTSHAISANGLPDKSYRELLQVFDDFDGRFLDQNQGNVSADILSAFAHARQGVVAKHSGDLQEAKYVYRKAIGHIDRAINHEPVAGMLFGMLLDARMNLVVLEKQTGNVDASSGEYKTVVRLLTDSQLPQSEYMKEYLTPLSRSIALAGIDLQCLPDALKAAHRFNDFAISSAASFPNDPRLQVDVVESANLIETITGLIHQQEQDVAQTLQRDENEK